MCEQGANLFRNTWEYINYLNQFLADSFDIGLTFGDQGFLFAKFLFKLIPSMGSFNNYVDKMRWVGGPKMSIFVHFQGKKVHVEVGRWSKQGKIMST